MQKRKIVYIGNKLSTRGATVTHIDTLSILLQSEGYTVRTASKYKNKIVRLLSMILTTFRFANSKSFLLLDTYSTQNFMYAVIVGRVCRILKAPYIPILHGGNLPARLEKSSKASQRLFKNAFINVAPSHYLIEAFKAKGFTNLLYIPNTIEIEKYPFLLRKDAQLRLLWVRSFSEIYNPTLAIDVLEKLLKEGYKATLTMVGPEKDGSLARCKEITRRKKLPVTFTGLLKKAQWIKLSKTHDFFINTTNFDNTPVSVMEAMALGLPVISTNVGGIPFLIKDSVDGLLVAPNNAAQFVEAILKLYNNPLLVASISSEARATATRFDWKSIKQFWFTLLDS